MGDSMPAATSASAKPLSNASRAPLLQQRPRCLEASYQLYRRQALALSDSRGCLLNVALLLTALVYLTKVLCKPWHDSLGYSIALGAQVLLLSTVSKDHYVRHRVKYAVAFRLAFSVAGVYNSVSFDSNHSYATTRSLVLSIVRSSGTLGYHWHSCILPLVWNQNIRSSVLEFYTITAVGSYRTTTAILRKPGSADAVQGLWHSFNAASDYVLTLTFSNWQSARPQLSAQDCCLCLCVFFNATLGFAVANIWVYAAEAWSRNKYTLVHEPESEDAWRWHHVYVVHFVLLAVTFLYGLVITWELIQAMARYTCVLHILMPSA